MTHQYIDIGYHCDNCGAWVLPGNTAYLSYGYCPFCGAQLKKFKREN